MAVGAIEGVGERTAQFIARIGEFSAFAGRALLHTPSVLRWRNMRLVLPQLYEVGFRSIMVVAITGAFIGMVLAIETYSQFKTIGQESRLGGIISLSVVKQIGPVLAAIMLAGRVGGALTAELGTMNVTEQLDALRVMGADPVRVLVVPRLVACVLLTPILTVFSDFLGVVGGWFIAVNVQGIPNDLYWRFAADGVDTWQVLEGIGKSVFFGSAIGLIGCFMGFTCGAGASGVGRACTQSFVSSFIAIMILNFFFAQVATDWYTAIFGVRSIFG